MDADVCTYFFVRKENNNKGGRGERGERKVCMYSCHVYMHYCTEESLHVKMSLYTMYMPS